MRFSIYRAGVFVSYCASLFLIWSTMIVLVNLSIDDKPQSDYNVEAVVNETDMDIEG